MACYKSLLARRIVLWYILLGSIVIFPLTLNVSLGCRFVTVVNKDDTENTGDVKNTVNNYDAQGLGPFNLAIYDSQQIVLGGTSDNFNTFLGCVDYSLFWREATGNDFAFTMHRVASGCLLAFTTLATIICTCLQCFTKRGKSHLWNVMRAFYIGALLSQGLMYSVFGSEMCKEEDNKCTPGRNGVAGAFNVVLLMGMVVATFLSLPPRNPVFQCWGSSESDYESDGDGSSTEEEDEVMRKFKSFGDAGGEKSVSGVENDSVSLFGGSRMSRKSRTTTKSLKSKLTEEDEVASAAENGLATAGEGESVSSSRSKQKSVVRVTTVDDGSSLASGKSGKSASSKMMPAISRYMFMGSKSSKDNDNHNHNHNHNHHDIELHDEKHSESDDSEKPWGKVVGASLLINLTTIAGVVLIAGHWLRDLICPKAEMKKKSQVFLFEVLVPMFACGALLATTFFILLPESFHIVSAQFNGSGGHDDHRLLAEDDHGDNEAAATWRWGSSIMGGFWIPLILQAFFTHEHNRGIEHENKHNTTEQQEEVDPEQGKTDKGHEDEFVMVCGLFRMKNVPLFVSYNLGELFHNFTDGIFVGVAFLGCSRDLQLSIMISTIYHELPNQFAGYLVMVNQCGMNPFVALFCNFVFGLSIMFGGLLVLAFDFNYVTIGCLLAMGGGTYLHVAISELLGNAQRNMKKGIEMIYMFIAFLVGALPIGLILLNHHHC